MCNPAYASIDHVPLYVSENSPLPKYESLPDRRGWTDDEIASIRTVLHKLTSTRVLNATDAEDLVQDTLLTMIAKHPGGSLEKGPLVWSLGILRRKVGNYYRRSQRISSLDEQGSRLQKGTRHSMPAASPEMKMCHKELQWIVGETLAQLPSTQREAMELLLAGLDTGEIAKQLQPERYQTVINRLFRARKKLAKELARYGYGPNGKTSLRKLKPCRIPRRNE